MSIKLRLWIAAVTVLAAACSVGAVVVRNQWLYQAELGRVRNQAQLRAALDLVDAGVKEAEAGQRGYLLTGIEDYLAPFNAAQARIAGDMASLQPDAGPDSKAAVLLRRLGELTAERLAELGQTVRLRREKGLEAALEMVRTQRGRVLMEAIRAIHAELLADIEGELRRARKRLDAAASRVELALAIGFPALLGVIALVFAATARGLIRPLRRLEAAISRVAAGETPSDVALTGTREFARVAVAFNLMASRLALAHAAQARSDRALEDANAALRQHSADLEQRTRKMETIGRLAQRLPCSTSMDEFTDVLRRFLPQILPDIPGGLFVLNNSRSMLRIEAAWGELHGSLTEFTPADCWALRRGQPHVIHDIGCDIGCAHVHQDRVVAYCCMPLIAQGTAVGLLYLEGELDPDSEVLQVLAETIALALVGLKLRDDLRNQSIRDPLTGLFNRRYLEESLAIETARTERSGSGFSVLMLDVDHFKRFNDTHGHNAGDLVLSEVGAMLRRQIRKGDVACRYGGEEFVVVLPGAGEAAARDRAEQIRMAAENIRLTHRGVELGPITISCGVAVYPGAGTDAEALIASADSALYAAKRAGRNRVELAPALAALSDAAD